MRKILLTILLLFGLLPQPAYSYSGNGSITAWPRGTFIPVMCKGDSSGFGDARSRCLARGGGVITLGPGLENMVYTPLPANSNITVINTFSSGFGATSLNTSSIGPAFGSRILFVDGNKYPISGVGIQQAIDDLPTQGGTVVLFDTLYTATTTIYTPCDRPVHLIGMSKQGGSLKGTQIRNSTGSDILWLRGNYDVVEKIAFSGTGAGGAANEEVGRGIVIGRRNRTDPHPAPGTSGNEISLGGGGVMTYYSVRDCEIYNTSGWSLFVSGWGKLSDGVTFESNKLDGTSLSIWGEVSNSTFSGATKYGALFIGKGNTTIHFSDCVFGVNTGHTGNNEFYTYLSSVYGITFTTCTWEGYQPGANPWFRIYWSNSIVLINPWFEHDGGETPIAPPTYFIDNVGACWGLKLTSPGFYRSSSTQTGYLRAINMGDGTRGCILENVIGAVYGDGYPGGNAVDTQQYKFNTAARDVTVLGMFTTLNGTDGLAYVPTILAPDRLTYLGDKGLVIPKWTKAQRDAEVYWRSDTIIYVPDSGAGHELQFYDGTNWYYLTKTIKGAGD